MSRNLGFILKEMGLISEADLQEGLEFQKKERIRLGEALVRLGKINKSQLDYVISRQIDLPFVIISREQIDLDLIKRFSLDFMKRHKALPIYIDEHSISVVTDDPFDNEIVEYFEKVSGRKVVLSVASEENILDILSIIGQKVVSDADMLAQLNFQYNLRYDFILIDNRLTIKSVGSNIETIYDREFYFKMSQVREVLKARYSFFYEEIISKSGVFMQVFFVTLDDGIYFSNLDYEGDAKVFKRNQPVLGYPFVSDVKINYDKLILLGKGE